jgi:hypothetical protein
LTGCAASGAKFHSLSKTPSESSEIIVYRPDRFIRGGASYQIHLDGQQIGILKNAGFIKIRTTPGSHILELKGGFMQASFRDIKTNVVSLSGERKIYRFEPIASGPIILASAYIGVTFSLSLVPEEVAIVELTDLKESD